MISGSSYLPGNIAIQPPGSGDLLGNIAIQPGDFYWVWAGPGILSRAGLGGDQLGFWGPQPADYRLQLQDCNG